MDEPKIRSHVASQTLPQRSVQSLHVVGLSGVLSDCLMAVLGQDQLISLPEVAVEHAKLLFSRDSHPQTPTSLFTVVTDSEGNNLPSSAAHDCPQPEIVDLFEHKDPGFIEFQHITRLSR